MNFMLLALKEFEPMTHGGLGQIPFKCFESIAKVMTDFALVEKEALGAENKLLREALYKLKTEKEDLVELSNKTQRDSFQRWNIRGIKMRDALQAVIDWDYQDLPHELRSQIEAALKGESHKV